MERCKMSSEWDVVEGKLVATFTATDPNGESESYEVELPLADMCGRGYDELNDVGRAALHAGLFTALRSAAGVQQTAADAIQAIRRRVETWHNGNWVSGRDNAGPLFNEHDLAVQAIVTTTNGKTSAADATASLNACAEKLMQEDAEMTRDAARRKTLQHLFRDQPRIKLTYDVMTAQRKAERAQEKLKMMNE